VCATTPEAKQIEFADIATRAKEPAFTGEQQPELKQRKHCNAASITSLNTHIVRISTAKKQKTFDKFVALWNAITRNDRDWPPSA